MNGIKYIRSQIINMTMEELAEKLQVSKQAVYTWESKMKKIPQKRLEQLSEMTGIPCEYFLREEITERDIWEIRTHGLNKVLQDTKADFEKRNISAHLDLELMEEIEGAGLLLQIKELQAKVESVICLGNAAENEHRLGGESLCEKEKRAELIGRFVEAVSKSRRSALLEDIVRAIELFVEEDNSDMLKMRLAQVLDNESVLTRAVYMVLLEEGNNME